MLPTGVMHRVPVIVTVIVIVAVAVAVAVVMIVGHRADGPGAVLVREALDWAVHSKNGTGIRELPA